MRLRRPFKRFNSAVSHRFGFLFGTNLFPGSFDFGFEPWKLPDAATMDYFLFEPRDRLKLSQTDVKRAAFA